MDASARMAFNMKVLRRHDPAIEDIIESASFVVLYSHDGEWVSFTSMWSLFSDH
jgi:hypothetical protein